MFFAEIKDWFVVGVGLPFLKCRIHRCYNACVLVLQADAIAAGFYPQ